MFRNAPATQVDGARETQASKTRWTAADIPDQSGRFYPITGDELVIVFRDVRTLNVRYMYLKPRL